MVTFGKIYVLMFKKAFEAGNVAIDFVPPVSDELREHVSQYYLATVVHAWREHFTNGPGRFEDLLDMSIEEAVFQQFTRAYATLKSLSVEKWWEFEFIAPRHIVPIEDFEAMTAMYQPSLPLGPLPRRVE